MTDPWEAQREALGAFIREQRKRANLSLRQLAELTSLSNPYLSQLERGLHQPSIRVLKLISDALNVSAETLLVQAAAGGVGSGAVQLGKAAGARVIVVLGGVLQRIGHEDLPSNHLNPERGVTGGQGRIRK